jgi:hypothetical protein
MYMHDLKKSVSSLNVYHSTEAESHMHIYNMPMPSLLNPYLKLQTLKKHHILHHGCANIK